MVFYELHHITTFWAFVDSLAHEFEYTCLRYSPIGRTFAHYMAILFPVLPCIEPIVAYDFEVPVWYVPDDCSDELLDCHCDVRRGFIVFRVVKGYFASTIRVYPAFGNSRVPDVPWTAPLKWTGS